MCFHNKELDFIFLLNRLVAYLLPTAKSFLTGNHLMDLLCLLKENFKNLLFDLASRICLTYQDVCFHKDEHFEEYARTYYEVLNQTMLRQKYWGAPLNTDYGLEDYGTH